VNGLAGHCGWPIHHLNVQIAFLNGVLDEEVYQVQLDGLATPNTQHLICQLHRTLYGLKAFVLGTLNWILPCSKPI
jgi:hypothetical protein